MLSVSVPHVCYQRPVWDLDGSFSVSSVFKSLLCWWKADTHMCSFGINPGDHQNFTESLFWALPSLPYFYGFFLVSGSLRLFSSVFQLKSWGFGYPTLSCTSAALPGSCQRIHTDKVMRLAPILLGPQLHQLERKVLLPQNFGSCNLPLSPSQDWLEAGMHWNEENGLCPVLGAPFSAPGAWTRGLLLLLFLCAGDHFYFQVEWCWIQDEGPKRGKNGKLATGLVVLWILVF